MGHGALISHSSLSLSVPLPQDGEGALLRAEVEERGTQEQVAVQKPPSGQGCPESHCSGASTVPLPHRCVGAIHRQLRQMVPAVHSASASHCSLPSRCPLPQVGAPEAADEEMTAMGWEEAVEETPCSV